MKLGCLVGALAAAVIFVVPAAASPAPIKITVDKSLGKVAGWSIGYSEALGGCLAAATFGEETTLWFGMGGTGTNYIAFTNPRWRTIEPGGQYQLRLLTNGHGAWKGTFTGFEHDEMMGVFQASLKGRFLSDLSDSGLITLELRGRRVTTLSLVGSTEALAAVMECQKERGGGRADVASTEGGKARREPGKASFGTGFFVSDKGHVLTNHHVVDTCSDYYVRRPGDPAIRARFVASDQKNDLAVLSTDSPQRSVPPLSVRARVGENVYVFGFPQVDTLASTGNFTVGNVTATAGVQDDTSKMQISAQIHMGNSGGPAIDQYGNVIGVVQSKRQMFASGDIAQNVNFAIKSTTALAFLEANGIEAPIDVRTTDSLDGATIAEKAKGFTVQIMCR